MTNEEIKNDCLVQYEQIRIAEERLKELRKLCQHEETFQGLYSWRPGAIESAIICSFCGTTVQFPDRPAMK